MTFADIIARTTGPGPHVVYVTPEEWASLEAELARLRRYVDDCGPSLQEPGGLAFYGTRGRIEVRVRAGLNIGRLLTNTAALGTTYFRDARKARARQEPTTRGCSYCGAPGQRIGARCEYCQVAVSA